MRPAPVRRLFAMLLALVGPATAAAQTSLTSVGSDTLGELMQAWAQAYALDAPQVRLQIRTPGSAAGPPAQAAGAAGIGPLCGAV